MRRRALDPERPGFNSSCCLCAGEWRFHLETATQLLSGDTWASPMVTTPFTALSLVTPLGSIVDISGLRGCSRPAPTHLKPSRCHISGDFVRPGLSTERCPPPWLHWFFSTRLRILPLLIPSEATSQAQGSHLRLLSEPLQSSIL